MGVNLLLVKNNRIIADLGRAYHYYENINEIEKDYAVLISRTLACRDNAIKRVNMYLGYSPPNIEVFADIRHIIEDEFENLRETLVQYGKKLLIADLLDDSDLEVITELEYEDKNKLDTSIRNSV